MSTALLYHDDSLLLEFEAEVVALGEQAGRPSVVLDRTAFYPEAGGQMSDRGTLAGAALADVQIDEAGTVHHILAEGTAPPVVGARVRGLIDRNRRRLHMALHTGQHMLSRALVEVVRGETVSARLGETACTIDIDREKLDEKDLLCAEELCNSVIDDDLQIRAFFPAPDELAALPLRRQPKVSEHIRVVQIGDFDVSPCGGTHCTRSAQVGLLRITGLERYKGKMRVSFVAGRRARTQLWSESDLLRGLSRDFTCGPAEVPAAIQKLRRELGDTRETLGQALARLADQSASALIEEARAKGTSIVALFDGVEVEFLRAIGKRVAVAPFALVGFLGARTPEGIKVLVVRSAQSRFDCGAFLKAAASAHAGRGGGSPERAEGKLPASADWQTIAGAANP
jgi:alanyl-tRNA synthetase